MKKLLLQRLIKNDTCTIGKLFIDGVYFCDTLEDRDRGLYQSMDEGVVKKMKVYGETCIPYGIYKVVLSFSPSFKRILPEVKSVKAFSGIRIHRGNYPKDTLGCILVGEHKIGNSIQNSTKYELKLLEILKNETNIELEII